MKLYPSISFKTPYWIYDTLEKVMDVRYSLLYTPHVPIHLYGSCFTVYCLNDASFYKRLIESCNGFVSHPLTCSIILAEERWLVPEVVRSSHSVFNLKWIVDSISQNTLLPFSEYSFSVVFNKQSIVRSALWELMNQWLAEYLRKTKSA